MQAPVVTRLGQNSKVDFGGNGVAVGLLPAPAHDRGYAAQIRFETDLPNSGENGDREVALQ